MRKFEHKRHIAYEIKRNKIVAIKRKDKIKFYFKGHGIKNLRFRIGLRSISIRLPFFYLSKHNNLEIGLPNLYLWFI